MQMENTNPISAHREGNASGRCLPSLSTRASSDSSTDWPEGDVADGDSRVIVFSSSEVSGRSVSDDWIALGGMLRLIVAIFNP